MSESCSVCGTDGKHIKCFSRQFEERRPLVNLWCTWVGTVGMDLKEMGCGLVDVIYLTQEKV